MVELGYFCCGFVVALVVAGIVAATTRKRGIARELRRFLGVNVAARLRLRQLRYPLHMAPEAKLALDELLAQPGVTSRVLGIPVTSTFMEEMGVGVLMAGTYETSAVQTQTFDLGDEQSIECPRHGLWLVECRGAKLAVLWTSTVSCSAGSFAAKLLLEVACVEGSGGHDAADEWIAALDRAVHAGRAYRGKILSLEEQDDYSGNSTGITIHRLRSVPRESVILPDSTVTLLERNVVRFVEQRSTLARLGMPTKKGLLFYGPPGTGKTHTIHYLIGALAGHTTLLITAEQIGQLTDYMMLARMLQPSLVIIEDVDLIAEHRDRSSTCEQSLLNRLLNEMDGLREDAAILFVLTTNRPQALEAALAARPGRVDQAVEFPLPDAAGREKLIHLYACGAKISDEVVHEAVRMTEGVSASFIKELMRRALQFNLECCASGETPEILRNDVDEAIDELLWSGGALNRALLGAGEASIE